MARPKPAMLAACLPLLQNIRDCDGSFGVFADNLIEAGMAVEAGYARAENDYEGPRLFLTEAGKKAIAKKPKRT